jgi:hypothetical protein
VSPRAKSFVLWAIAYTAVYSAVVLVVAAACWASGYTPPDWMFFAILPFHFLGMAQNFVAFLLTVNDLAQRPFPFRWKLAWLAAFFFTGGIAWIVYVFRHAIKPRYSRPPRYPQPA